MDILTHGKNNRLQGKNGTFDQYLHPGKVVSTKKGLRNAKQRTLHSIYSGNYNQVKVSYPADIKTKYQILPYNQTDLPRKESYSSVRSCSESG
jgi:hypothetical protein